MNILLLSLSVLPVILLMVFIYRQDKYQKEPIRSLAKAFIGGMLAIPLDILIVSTINQIWVSNTVFYTAFWQAGIPEELSKFIIFMVLIWWDKNFDEYMDGIVYASFIGLGFACVENIMYVFGAAASESLQIGISTSISRALLSVPGHFLFGVVMGYFLSLAKFNKTKRFVHLMSGLLLAMFAHGLFDWLLMITSVLPLVGGIVYLVFLWGDIKLWKLGLKYIRKQQENSLRQNQEAAFDELKKQIHSDSNFDSEYKRIDWNAGNRQ